MTPALDLLGPPEATTRRLLRDAVAPDADRFAAYIIAGISTEDRCKRGICLLVDRVVHKLQIEDAPWSHELAIEEFESALQRRDAQANADLRAMTDAAEEALHKSGEVFSAARAAADVARERRSFPHIVHAAVRLAKWRVRQAMG